MNNMDIYNAVRAVPETAQTTIKGGRLNGMTDINPMWRIQTLTELFGPAGVGWYYKIVRKWTEDGAGEEKAAFVDIELYIKQGDNWSAPIEGTGGSMLVAKEKSGLHTSDEAYKMALTDAISVACKALGIGADIYWGAGRSKYNDGSEREDVPFPEADKTISEKQVKTINGILSIYPKETRQTTLRLALAKYGVTNLEDLNAGQYGKFLPKLIESANSILPAHLDNLIAGFADKANVDKEAALQMIEQGANVSLADLTVGAYPPFYKVYKQMYKDLGNE